MKDIIFDNFQNSVDGSLLRHKSILDIMTKLQESDGRINRAIAKSVTNCGCIHIEAKSQLPTEDSEDININELPNILDTHTRGILCENCREVIEREVGNHLFYLTSLCNTLDLNLYDILLREYDRINTLGKYSLR
ncbi:DUF1573 domain-containing protein [uncultured Clostridium sp.]|uniref:DUF1573 domain-containing protein n=1 Tax=uncultured Clostridium sp. TaxID=59620 RepID=UPI0028EE37C4|nr:DUF1573 domain-containing protein [uncultured Clostridium sp.]